MSDSQETKQFKRILDSIADGVFTVDSDFNITFFNSAAEKITGISRNQAIGQKCFDVLKANICENACALKQAIETEKGVIDLHINILNSYGDSVPVSISTSVLKNDADQVVGGVETFRDLSTIELLRKEISKNYTFEDIISRNSEIHRIISLLPDIAKSGSSVLIEGPSGSGKELFAKAIHNQSGREGKFIALNCAALPDTLLESELFGYRKGAFSDAKTDKPGRFKLAEGGTLFLDEIGDISPALQVKLLRVLQEMEYEPLGATETVKADVRIVTATNKSLSGLANENRFRTDLLYRLNVVRISIPPLSRRREDIPLLIEHFIQKFNALKGKEILSVSDDVLHLLMNYDYPGNVRELENFIEHAFVMCHGPIIDVMHLPLELSENVSAVAASETVPANPIHSAEANAIIEALQRHDGHRRKTAEYLGINKSTLWRKMKKYNITYRELTP